MKQVAQRPRDGRISVEDVPLPALRPGWLLVANRYSLISAGTERSKVVLGEKSLLGKARSRPDLVRKVVERARTEGIRSTWGVTRDRLDALVELGYSSAGVVLEVGSDVAGYAVGDRVACAGGGFANHAEVVAVPRTLVAHVPDTVELEDAAYATVGAIALHGMRQAEASFGERVGVVGLGLVGQLAVRVARAAGCLPIGIDIDPRAVELASGGSPAFLRDDPMLAARVREATECLGLDSVLVCAASSSADPVALAAELARDRGRIVIVGDVPIEVGRAIFYEKELELRVSRSYGPGRYDAEYEERGRDLPPGYVRWTEQRNVQAFVDLVAAGSLRPSELTTHRFSVDAAAEAYELLKGTDGERTFGVLLEYEERKAGQSRPLLPARHRASGAPTIGLIGAGAFARATLLPGLRAAGAELVAVSSEGGLSAADVAQRFGFDRAATTEELLADDSIAAIVIATRHQDHARLVVDGLRAGKAVFVEKPLALTAAELGEVAAALTDDALLMVGFNRRFAPLVERLRLALAGIEDIVLTARVNAGRLPASHWLHDIESGGGRLLGEGCHFVDLLLELAGAPAVRVDAVAVAQPERPLEASDSVAATLRCANGAVATLAYSGGGDTSLPKERFEAFGGGLAAVLDDFRRLELHRGGKTEVEKSAQDKGHRAELACFVDAVAGRAPAPPAESYLASMQATLALLDSLRSGRAVELPR